MKTIHKKNTTFLNLAAGLLVAALVLGCNTNVSNGSEVQPEKFTVTFNVNGGNGKLTATVDGKAITSPVQVEKDKTVIFTATPHNNYAVDKWSITPSNALIENGKAEDTTAKVKVTENTTVNVTFKSTAVQPPTPPVTDGCTVTMSAGANGSITADPVIPAGGKVAKDTEITFTATANPGYRVDTWTVTPAEALIQGGQAGNTTAKVKVTANTTVNVTFKSTAVQPPTPPVTDGCTVTMSAGANGSITANPVIPAGGKVAKDAEITFTATANPGYRVDTWTVTPTEALIADGQQGDATVKVKVTANTTVNVTFKSTAVQPPTPPVTDGCTVTMSAGANGSITANPVIPAGDKVAKDTEITFTATANPGYRVDTWTITGGTIQAGGQQGDTTAKVKVTANTTVNVTFKAIKYPVTMTHGEHGDITANMSIPAEGIDYGTEITFTATANPGYRVDTWTVTPAEALIADGQQGNTTAKVKVTANTTVNVTFKAIKYPVTMTHGEHGDITADMSIPAEGIDYGTEITFTATANPGYRVDTWTITGGTIQAGGQQGDATAKVKVTANTIVNVTFKAIKYPVTMTHGEHGDITANMSIPAEGIDYGTEITFTTTANPGYRVDTWTVTPAEALIADGQQGNTTAKVKVTANTTVNVTFKPIVYTPVAYADLHNHLTTAQPETNGIYYIEVTGLTAPDVKGNSIGNSASPLGQILNSNRQKKVALKFGTMPYVTDMTNCFNGCTSLVQVSNIPDSITNMWECFKGCTKLEQVPNIPNSVTNMYSCFKGCTKLERVPNIPNSVTDMSFCFKGCTKLERVPNLPDGVTNMSYCFDGCTKLEQVPNIPNSVTDMSYCFDGCTKLEQVPNIPNSVTDMYSCFKGCTKLERVPNLPDGVTNMSYCFKGCTKLEQVPNIPNSVTNMRYCFGDCTKLVQVTNIPDGVTDMFCCFENCTSLTSVTLKCEYLDGKFDYAFSGCSSLSADSIKVPADSLDDYKDNADKIGAKAEWFAKDE
ncbi:leucine-rich repeat protein [Treponema vincentii]|uniref:InlB B-repeat-containing protein n=1 Tax=Treponema vincentii TaxID=69710 RepID=UPI003D91E048